MKNINSVSRRGIRHTRAEQPRRIEDVLQLKLSVSYAGETGNAPLTSEDRIRLLAFAKTNKLTVPETVALAVRVFVYEDGPSWLCPSDGDVLKLAGKLCDEAI